MALTKEALLIEVKAQSKEAQKAFTDTTKKVEELATQTEKTSARSTKAIQDLEKKMMRLATQIQQSEGLNPAFDIDEKFLRQVEKSMAAADNRIERTGQSSNNTAKEIRKLSKSMKELNNQSGVTVNSVNALVNSVTKIGITVVAVVTAVNQIIDVLKLLTSKEQLAKLATLLKVLSFILTMKGQGGLASFFTSAARAVEDLSVQVEKLKEDATRSIDRLIGQARLYDNVMQALGSTGKIVTSILTATFVKAAATGLETVSKNSKSVGVFAVFARRRISQLASAINLLSDAMLFLAGVPPVGTAFDAIIDSRKLQRGLKTTIEDIKRLRAAIPKVFNEIKSSVSNSVTSIQNSFVILTKNASSSLDKLSKNFFNLKFLSDFIQKSLDQTGKRISITFRGFSRGAIKEISSFEKALFNFQFIIATLTNFVSTRFMRVFSAVSNSFQQMARNFDLSKILERGQLAFTKAFATFKEFSVVFAKAFNEDIRETLRSIKNIIKARVTDFKILQSSVKNLGTVAKTVTAPSLLALTKTGATLGPVIQAIGFAAFTSETALGKLAGTALLIASVAMLGFASAITFLLSVAGNFISMVGDRMIRAMEKFEDKAAKSELVLRQFTFTIQGFGRELGEQATGNLEFWNKQVARIAENTSIAADDIRQSVILLVSEGVKLGLTQEQNAMLLERAADVSKAFSKEMKEGTQIIIDGIRGQTQSLAGMSIFLDEASLSHSKYLKATGKTTKQLESAELVQVRFNEFMKQSAPFIGLAADQLDTIAGSNEKFEQSLNSAQIALGKQSRATVTYNKALREMVNTFLLLPDPILSIIGNLIDFGGVVLKIGGFILSWAVAVSSIVFLLKGFNFVLAQAGLTAFLFNSGLNKLATVVGVTLTNPINSLTRLLSAMSKILGGVVVMSLKSVGASAVAAAGKISVFTAQLLINPLFQKAAAIAAAIGLIVFAISKFNKELEFLSNLFSPTTKTFLMFIAAIAGGIFALSRITAVKMLFTKWTKILVTALLVEISVQKTLMGTIIGTARAIKTVMIAALKNFIATVVGATAAVRAFTVAVLTNPIFLATAAIVAFLVALAVAIQELKEEISFFSDTVDENSEVAEKNSKNISLLSRSWEIFKRIVVGVAIVLKEFVKFLATAFVGAVLAAQLAWSMFSKLFLTGNDLSQAEEDILDIKRKIDELSRSIRKTGDSMVNAFSKGNMAAKEFEDTVEKATFTLADFRAANERLNRVSFFGDQTLRTQVFGSEIEKLKETFLDANQSMAIAMDRLNQGGEDQIELEKRAMESQKNREVARLNLIKGTMDIIGKLGEEVERNSEMQLQAEGKLVELQALRNEKALENFDKEAAALMKIGILRKKDIALIEATRKKLVDQNKEALKLAKQEQRKKDNREVLAIVDKIAKRQADQTSELARLGSSETELIALQHQREIAEIKIATEKVNSLDISEKERKKLLEQLGIAKKISKEIADRRTLEAEKKAAESGPGGALIGAAKTVGTTIEAAGGPVAEAIGGAFTGPGMTAALGMMGAAQAFVDAAQALVDFLPNFLNSIADLFNSLTDLPLKIAEAVLNVFDSVINFLGNFLPNIVKMVEEILVGFVDFLLAIPDTLIKMITETLPDMIQSLIDRLPEIVMKFIESMISAIPKLLVATIRMFELMFIKLPIMIIKAIPAIIEGIVEGIVKGVEEAMNAVLSLFGQGFDDGLKATEEQIKKIAREATDAASQVFRVSELRAPGVTDADRFAEEVAQAARSAKDILQEWWDKTFGSLSVSGLVTTLETFWADTFGALSISGLETTLQDFWDDTFGKASLSKLQENLEDFWKRTFGALSFSGLQTTWDTTFGLLSWDGLQTTWNTTFGKLSWDGLQTTYDSTLGKLSWDGLQTTWDTTFGQLSFSGLQTTWDTTFGKLSAGGLSTTLAPVQTAWDNTFGKLNSEKLSENFGAPIQRVWDDTFGQISAEGLKTSWKSVETAWANSFGKLSVSGLETTFKDLGKKVWDGLSEALANVGETFKKMGTNIWEGLKSGLTGIGTAITDELNKLNPANLFDKIFHVPESQKTQGTVEKVLGVTIPFVDFNRGGNVVPGDAVFRGDHPANDVVPAMLSPGEVVLPRSVVSAPGADKVIEALLRKEKIPGFASVKIGGHTISVTDKGVSVSGVSTPKLSVDDLKKISVNDLKKVSINDIIDAANQIVQGGGEAIKGIAKSASQLAKDLLRELGLDDLWAGVLDRLKDALMNMFGSAPGFDDAAPPGDVRSEFNFGAELSESIQQLQNLAQQGILTDVEAMNMAANQAAASGVIPIPGLAGGGMIRMENGGVVPGEGRGDIVPAMLEPGELVLPRGKMKMGETTVNNEFNLEITINAEEKIDEDFIRDTLFPEIRDELRRQSLEGRRMLASEGIR